MVLHVCEDCEIFVQFSPIHSKKGVIVQSLEGKNATGGIGDNGEKLDAGNIGDNDVGGTGIGGSGGGGGRISDGS